MFIASAQLKNSNPAATLQLMMSSNHCAAPKPFSGTCQQERDSGVHEFSVV